jgi:hypothetical protein
MKVCGVFTTYYVARSGLCVQSIELKTKSTRIDVNPYSATTYRF